MAPKGPWVALGYPDATPTLTFPLVQLGCRGDVRDMTGVTTCVIPVCQRSLGRLPSLLERSSRSLLVSRVLSLLMEGVSPPPFRRAMPPSLVRPLYCFNVMQSGYLLTSVAKGLRRIFCDL